MSVTIKCERPFGKNSLKEIIESCSCCPPMGPQYPSCSISCSPQPISCYTCPTSPYKLEPKPSRCPPVSVTCMPCSPQSSSLPCVPRPFICSPCTSRITCVLIPKPVPAPYEVGSVFRVPVTTGGLFYVGTIRC